MGRSAADDRALPDPWVPHRDRAAYVIAAILLVLELPILAVLGLASLVTRSLVAAVQRRSRAHSAT